ncbi:hypothetical protein A6X21_09490 [Planctopirus hydrillae]|uniref:Uncharacterized protein n=1 Tax=Planctopirus hydrillae TaxID=1841610 RepID=A0A1C3E7V4_9PLAN|nr:hypothetical protein A6X21_09490 [Planctopirus hydrillae]
MLGTFAISSLNELLLIPRHFILSFVTTRCEREKCVAAGFYAILNAKTSTLRTLGLSIRVHRPLAKRTPGTPGGFVGQSEGPLPEGQPLY